MENSIRNRKTASISKEPSSAPAHRNKTKVDLDLSKPVDPYIRFSAFHDDDDDELEQQGFFNTSLNVLLFSVGCGFLMYATRNYTAYLKTLHENLNSFSNITNLEREISLRGESGLYYSYYKQLLLAPSLWKGIQSLLKETSTECWREINILERFNVYQEVVLAFLYKSSGFTERTYDKLFFYIDAVFMLQGIYLGTIYLIAWFITGSYLSGMMSAMFFVFNRQHATRVDFTIALRESFALPFIYIQILLVCVVLSLEKNKFKYTWVKSQGKKILLGLVYASTLTYCALWQFGQYVVMLNSISIFGLHLLSIISAKNAKNLLASNLLALAGTFVAQFGNSIILCSFGLHFHIVALIYINFEQKLNVRRKYFSNSMTLDFIYSSFTIASTVILTVLLSFFVKSVLGIQSDDHIHKFLMNKLGFANGATDFDVLLYLCNDGYEFLPLWVIESLTDKTLLFPIFMIAQVYFVVFILVSWMNTKIRPNEKYESYMTVLEDFKPRPELAFIAAQSILFFILAVSSSEMKYLWVPIASVVASVFITDADYSFYKTFMRTKFNIELLRHAFAVGLMCLLYLANIKEINSELDTIQRFYDPDTVQLMEWIDHTPMNASFAGSMQLLASVKLCTGRKLAIHPHFEDKQLRDTAREIYQMYAHRPVNQVIDILHKYKTEYIILENNVCYTDNLNYCSLIEIMDINNKHLLPEGVKGEEINPEVGRFCDELMHGSPDYKKHFEMLLTNPTFSVFKLIKQQQQKTLLFY